MITGLGLLVLALLLRTASINRHVRKRTLVSAVLFGTAAVVSILLPRVGLGDAVQKQLEVVAPLLIVFGVVNLFVTLAINPWRADRVPDRFPGIVQDALIIGLFAVGATILAPSYLLATTAVGAVVIGLALQDTLGNLFAGLAFQIEKPFRIGDWVNVAGRDGLVSEITWRAAKIRTKSGNLVVVPNSVLARDTITNYSEPTLQVRLEVLVGADFEAPPNDVKAVIRDAIAGEPLIDRARDIDVLIADFGASAVMYKVRVWTTHFEDDERLCDRVRSCIYYAFRRHHIGIPYPIQVQIERKWEEAAAIDDRETTVALKATSLFVTLSEQQLLDLAHSARGVTYGTGERIVNEGEQGRSMFVVRRGEATVHIAGSNTPVAHFRKWDFFGEMSLLTGEPRTATVMAATDCDLIEIDADGFRRVALNDPAVVARVVEAVETRRSDLERRRAAIPPPLPAEQPRTLLDRVRRFLSMPTMTS